MEKNKIILKHLRDDWDFYEEAYSHDSTRLLDALAVNFFLDSDLWALNDPWYREQAEAFADMDLDWEDYTKEEQDEAMAKIYQTLKEYKGEDEDEY